ncbi:MAG TPA: tRNA (N(6)-L-threonylcarbamoyladenosine(37)-C(2))-methylthiotransferase MtaB [Salinivirgaceae bacterium]|nr:tRNA (N(6)-L-threonylcarbamoyladenosine(37)-C(2))-methylthiotransferase MtaB [Salinivirgaceae bacterium]
MQTHKKVAFHTLGCKLNFSETSTIARTFVDAGYIKVDFNDLADIYVINTCSVTEIAEKKCKYVINRAAKQNPEAKIVVIGCFAQLRPEQLMAINGVDIVLSNRDKHQVLEYVENNATTLSRCDYKELNSFQTAWSFDDRTRSFLKIQDGCDYFCSYCTIPKARGLSRSDSIKSIIEKANIIVNKGVKEIVLTGVNIGDFGRKNGETFYDLLKAFHDVNGLQRLRLSSIEPNLLEDRIIELTAKSNIIMPHFHIPLQCGTDKLLKLMKRRYNTQLFKEKIETIRYLMPDVYIAIDIIVGVPEESEQDFQQTIAFIESFAPSELHIFTYSERKDTVAVRMQQVPKNIRKDRSYILHEKAKRYNNEFCKQFESKVRNVLFEKGKKRTIIEGFTDNYLKVVVPYNEGYINEILPVELLKYDIDKQHFIGKVVNC